MDPQKKKLVQTAVFALVVVVVVGGATLLSQQEGPPHMPPTAPHKLKINLKGELLGLQIEPEAQDIPLDAHFTLEKKAVEARVNTRCTTCHGAAGEDLTNHACTTGAGPCLKEHHPPKSECIKCHRMTPSQP